MAEILTGIALILLAVISYWQTKERKLQKEQELIIDSMTEPSNIAKDLIANTGMENSLKEYMIEMESCLHESDTIGVRGVMDRVGHCILWKYVSQEMKDAYGQLIIRYNLLKLRQEGILIEN